MTDFSGLLQTLSRGCVNFIVAGGAAATAHGSARLTIDILVKALAPLRPYLRDAPPGLPFSFDEATARRGLNFMLITTLGPLDLFGELTGGGTYERLLPESKSIELFGMTCRCLSLDQLIAVKRASGRPKDLEALAELETIREERQRR